VESDRLLAGEHPGFAGLERMEHRLRALVNAGIDSFLDLTEEGETESYSGLIAAASSVTPVVHLRRPIPDMGVPSVEHMVETLDLLDESLRTHRTTYLHCLAGAGRTGLVVGCHLVRHGMSGGMALQQIGRLRAGLRRNGLESPITDAQRDFVLDWAAGR
jgi:protein-tyrosine phosphatase